MNVGDRVKFQFAGKEKEGVVVRIFPKKVYLKADFPRHSGRIVVRPIATLEGKGAASAKKKKKEKRAKEKKKKIQRPVEKKGEELKE